MNYRKIDFFAGEMDKESQSLLMQIAKWHNLTPKLWVPNYKAYETDIEETIKIILDTEKEDLFIGIAEDEQGKIQGFIWVDRQKECKDKVMILSLYVTEDHRKYGVATNLKMLLEEWCRAQGIKSIRTTVHYTNHNMLVLNQKLGYTPGMVNMTKNLT